MKLFTAFLMLGISTQVFADNLAPASDRPIILIGDLKNYNYPGLEDHISDTWNYVKTAAGIKITPEAPLINFEPFIFAKENPTWLDTQKKWINDHPEIWDDWNKSSNGAKPAEDGNPFPTFFAAFEYYGSSHIQVNPGFSFIPYYKSDDNGFQHDIVGLGYYTVGHELHHYALSLMNVPIKLHHCIFVSARGSTEKSMMEGLSDFLIDHQISSFLARFKGSDAETMLEPCRDLSSEDQKAAADWAQKF